MFKAPTVVGRLKSKLKDVNVDSSMVLRTVLELSSLWVGLESLVSQISVPGTRTASWSMWAELTYNCGVCLDGHRSVLPPPDPNHRFFFWFLFPTLPAVENSHHKEPEVRAFWNPRGGQSQRKWMLWSPQGNIFPVSNIIPWTGHRGQVQGSFP